MATNVIYGGQHGYDDSWNDMGRGIQQGLQGVLGFYQDYTRQKRFELQQQEDHRIKAQQMAERAQQNEAIRENYEDARNARRAQAATQRALLTPADTDISQLPPEWVQEQTVQAPKMATDVGIKDAPEEVGGPLASQIQVGTQEKTVKKPKAYVEYGDYVAPLDIGGVAAQKRATAEKLASGQVFKNSPELIAELERVSPTLAALYRNQEYLPGNVASALASAQKTADKHVEMNGRLFERTPEGKWVEVARAPKESTGAEGGSYKAVYDREAKADVMANDAMIAQNPARYGPPQKSGGEGKPLLSGEIGQIRDFVSGMNQLSTLMDEAQKTGTIPWAQTKTPNIITQWLGWGTDAKSRQASLDAAKQVIGKAMEGGVLRKEDEAKYVKILPTIKDAPEVARRKIQNLIVTMKRDAETYIEILAGAGRNTSGVEDIVRKTGERTSREVGNTAAAAPNADPYGLR